MSKFVLFNVIFDDKCNVCWVIIGNKEINVRNIELIVVNFFNSDDIYFFVFCFGWIFGM